MQFMVSLDQAAALRSETRRQETEIEMFNSGGESRTACIARNVCRDFHRPASQEANTFRSGRQHNDLRHISSMEVRGHFHRKKIANATSAQENPRWPR